LEFASYHFLQIPTGSEPVRGLCSDILTAPFTL
jgi:hypothetical protein